MTLNELQAGKSARISRVDCHADGVLRLMVLGMVEGARVTFRHAAIGGDPIEIDLMGAAISLRKAQAQHFLLDPSLD